MITINSRNEIHIIFADDGGYVITKNAMITTAKVGGDTMSISRYGNNEENVSKVLVAATIDNALVLVRQLMEQVREGS